MLVRLIQRIKQSSPSKKIPYLNYILIAILVLGIFIRAFKLTSLPMYGDELTIVYDAYSILKTGEDQTGEFLPLTFKMGAGRLPVYVYGTVPFVALFGPTEVAVRSLSFLSSLGIIILMYFLGKKLFSKKVGVYASFFASISMWDIYLSRAGFEAHFALFLALLGILLFLHKKYISMALAWGLTIFTYPTFKLTIPLLFVALLFFENIKVILKNKFFYIALLILGIFAIFSISETLKGTSEVRFLNLNIFADKNLEEIIIQDINEKRNLSKLPESIKPLIYNRPLRYTRILFENYVENLSPNFLFLRGDRNPRTNPGEMGMLYLFDFILITVGLYYLANNEKRKLKLLVTWILIIPLATMLLGQTHALRNNLMLPALLLISAYGFTKLKVNTKLVLLVAIFIQLAISLVTIYYYAPNKFGSFWSKEAKIKSLEAIDIGKNNEVILSTKIDNIEYAYPVYAKIDPSEVISQFGKWPKVYGKVTISDVKK